MAVLTEKRRPVHEPLARYVIDGSSYNLRALGVRGEHPLGPIRRDNDMIFDHAYDFAARFPEC
jgi:hypothetical protein